MSKTQDILIQGVGGVGGLLAGELIRAGYNPMLVTNNQKITDAINNNGIRFITPSMDDYHTVETQAFTTLDDLPEGKQFDAVYLIMKANNVLEAADQTKPLLKEDGYIVSFQNGLVEDAIGEIVGTERVVSAIVVFGSNMEEPGVYRRTTEGMVYIGELDGTISPRIQILEETLSHAIPIEVSQNMLGVLWGKLCWNCAVSGLCAVAGGTFGDLVSTRKGRDLFLWMYREVIDTAVAQNITIEPIVLSAMEFYLPIDADQATRNEKDELVQGLIPKYADVLPSSLQSLRRNRPTETQFLNTYLVNKAKQYDVETPLNAAVAEMIYAIEADERDIDEAALDELHRLGTAQITSEPTMPNFPLDVYEYGNPDNLTLILLHGGAGLHHLWQPQLETLSEQYHLIAPDLFYEDINRLTIPNLAEDVAELIRQKVGGATYLIGISFGALVAMQVAIQDKTLVKGLAISGARISGATRDKFNAFMTGFMGERAIVTTLAETVKEMDETLGDVALADMEKLGKKGFRAIIQATSQVDFQRHLAKINMPTLVMVGSHDHVNVQQAADEIYEALADSELHVVDGVGHHWNLEDPALFNQMIIDFVTQVENDEF